MRKLLQSHRFLKIAAIAVVLLATLPVRPLPTPGQTKTTSRADGPEEVAQKWAKGMILSLRTDRRRDDVGRVIALQPLHPENFPMLTARQRRRLYEWLLHAFGETALDSYSLVDRARLREVARVLEETGAKDWMDRYKTVLDKAAARINIVCEGFSMGTEVGLSCSALDRQDGGSVGRANSLFKLEWLNRPIALELAIRSFAAKLVRRLQARGTLVEVKVMDGTTGGTTPLSLHVARTLEDAIHDQVRSYTGTRRVGTDEAEAEYRVEGKIRALDGSKAVLRVAVRWADHRVSLGREHFLMPERFAVKGDAMLAAIRLPSGLTLADWLALANEGLTAGEHTRVLSEVTTHIRDFGRIAALLDIRQRAESHLFQGVRIARKEDAPAALEHLERIKQITGERPALIRLTARAHRLLGDYTAELSAHLLWLRTAPQDHPERGAVRSALSRARAAIAESARFAEILGRPFSAEAKDPATGWTDLHYAAWFDLPAVVAALVDAGLPTDSRLTDGAPQFPKHMQGHFKTLPQRGNIASWVTAEGTPWWYGGGDTPWWYLGGETPLIVAAASNASAAAAELLARDADVNAVNNGYWAPLHLAALVNASAVSAQLISNGARLDVSYTVDTGMFSNAERIIRDTPLIYAATEGAVEVMLQLISAGADVAVHRRDSSSRMGPMPLQIVVQHQGTAEVVTALLEAGASVNPSNNEYSSPLHYAAYYNNVSAVKILLAHGAYIEGSGAEYYNEFYPGAVEGTPLHSAAEGNAYEAATALISAGANIHAEASDGSTPLEAAAEANAEAVLRLLLPSAARFSLDPALDRALAGNALTAVQILHQHGASVRWQDEAGATPLHHAAKHHDSVDVASWLLDHGADAAAVTHDGDTVLHRAAARNNVRLAALLFDYGATSYINARNKAGKTPLHTALHEAAEHNPQIVALLLEGGADIDAADDNGRTALHYVLRSGYDDLVTLLLERGADIDAADDDGWTALHHVAVAGLNRDKLFTLLLQRNATVNRQTKAGKTPLHLAMGEDDVENVRRLLASGADVNAPDAAGEAPLHVAVRHDSVNAAALLLKRGGDINATNNRGWTALHMAAGRDSTKMTAFLLSQGMDIDSPTKGEGNKYTPLHIAAGNNALGVAKLLLDRGADSDGDGLTGLTPLHIAAQLDKKEMAAMLLDRGVNIQATEKYGNTPLHYAAGKNARATVEFLVGRGADVNVKNTSGMSPWDFVIELFSGNDTQRSEMLATLQRLGGRCAESC